MSGLRNLLSPSTLDLLPAIRAMDSIYTTAATAKNLVFAPGWEERHRLLTAMAAGALLHRALAPSTPVKAAYYWGPLISGAGATFSSSGGTRATLAPEKDRTRADKKLGQPPEFDLQDGPRKDDPEL